MALNTGTHDISDLLSVKVGTAFQYGTERIAAILNADLAAYNAALRMAVSDIAEVTTNTVGIYGIGTGGQMIKVDEYGRGPTQKPGEPSPVAFPLEKYQFPLGYTVNYLKSATPAEVASRALSAQAAHRVAVQNEIAGAFFGSTNRSMSDYLVTKQAIVVRRLVNADSQAIPLGPNGESFDGATHTHYDGIDWSAANTAQRTAAVSALITDVVEHGHGAGVRVIINKAQEADVRALTGFTAYLDVRVSGATNVNQAAGVLDTSRNDNRAIGLFDGAEVWVKPWVPASYIGAYAQGDTRKPLALRQRAEDAFQGLVLAGTNMAHQLQADFMEAEFGVGAMTRTNGAALFLGNATYATYTPS